MIITGSCGVVGGGLSKESCDGLGGGVVYEDNTGGLGGSVINVFHQFGWVGLLEEVLVGMGGIREVLKVEWDSVEGVGVVVCLLNDWRVFRFFAATDEFKDLGIGACRDKIERDCKIFEDMDDWYIWEELVGDKVLKLRNEIDRKFLKDNRKDKVGDILRDFFATGNSKELVDMMSKSKSGV